MVFRATTDSERAFARQAAKKSPVGRTPSECGRASWAKRPAEQKARETTTLLAHADRRKGGLALAALIASEPDASLWFRITKMRTQAIKRGEIPPAYMKLVPIEPPASVKQVGRSARKKAEKRAHDQANVQAQAAQQKPPGSVEE
jgi:hypothetical protein